MSTKSLSIKISEKIQVFCDLTKNKAGGIIFLNGPWGSGKTYFWKSLSSKFTQKPIYVSLFGARSTSDVKTKITTAIIAGTDDSKGIGKVRTFVSKLNLPGLLSGFTGLNLDLDVIELLQDRKVICFDDLERLPADSNIEEILGFINHLAEHKGHRCVIILNISEMNSGLKDIFFRLREKLSFSTVEYKLDLRERIESFFTERFGASDFSERKFLVEHIVDLKLDNLRLVKAIVDSLFEIKSINKEAISEDVLKFLVSVLAHDAEGNRCDFDFFTFTPIQFHFSEKSGTDEEKAADAEKKKYYEKYFGKNAGYHPIKAIFNFIRDGILDESEFNNEVFGTGTVEDKVSQRIKQIRDIRYFFSTDQELDSLQKELFQIAKLSRAFTISEVSTLVRSYSSSIKLLEQPYPLHLPDEFKKIAVESIKSVDDLWELRTSFGYRGDEIIRPFGQEMSAIVTNEELRRATEKYNASMQSFDPDLLREAIAIDGKCILTISSSGDFKKILNGTCSQQIKTDLSTLIIEGLQLQRSSEPKAVQELSAVANELNTFYGALTSKTERLRIYRLIEQTGLGLPQDKPTVVL